MKDRENLIHEWCCDYEPPRIFPDREDTNAKASDYAKMNRGDCRPLIKTFMHVLEMRAREYERNWKPCAIIDINNNPWQERK